MKYEGLSPLAVVTYDAYAPRPMVLETIRNGRSDGRAANWEAWAIVYVYVSVFPRLAPSETQLQQDIEATYSLSLVPPVEQPQDGFQNRF